MQGSRRDDRLTEAAVCWTRAGEQIAAKAPARASATQRLRAIVLPLVCAAVLGPVVPSGCADPFASVDDQAPECDAAETRCEANSYQVCTNGRWSSEACGEGTCIADKGCLPCAPSTSYCLGQEVYQCNAEGTEQTLVSTCAAEEDCVLGSCVNHCDRLGRDRSNVGCEFWAVDLPNEYYCQSLDGGATCLMYGCAACQQFAVAVGNTSGLTVRVKVEINQAAPGQSPQLKEVASVELKPDALEIIKLPMREVDCSEWKKDTSGRLRRVGDSHTCLSSKAYRIQTSYPVVAYQFNPLNNDFSNGASLLIPQNGLDTEYLALSWNTNNPVAVPLPGNVIEGVPDYMNLTIVGTEDGTTVDVQVTHTTQGSQDGKIAAAKAGETVSITLDRFDVLNLNSIQSLADLANATGDLTGSFVRASKPVAVFSGGQRVSVPGVDRYDPPLPPGAKPKPCCTEHIEQQMFPVSALGKQFAVTHTPVRSGGPQIEPDLYRILAVEDGTEVTTTAANFPKFTLAARKVAALWSTEAFTVTSTKPVMLAQYSVSKDYIARQSGPPGDPDFVVFPPVEQYRKEYIFLTPSTFDRDFVVVAAPEDATVKLDGNDVSAEFSTTCTRAPVGVAGDSKYLALTCRVEDGVHRIEATKPVGIMVYGYYTAGSYGYPGGADVRQINVQ